MTTTYPTGWDRTNPDEWAKLPGPIMRWVMVMRFRKEISGGYIEPENKIRAVASAEENMRGHGKHVAKEEA